MQERRADKWRPVTLFWSAQAVAIFFGWPLLFSDPRPPELSEFFRPENALPMAGAVLVITALQAVFLWPVRRPAGRRDEGVSLWLSIGLAALAVATLSAGAVVAGVEAADQFGGPNLDDYMGWTLLGTMAVSWAVATPLLMAFCRRGRRESRLSRIAAVLFLGTLVELAAVIPLDAMIRRKTNCYCFAGTYLALIACLAVGSFALGPAVFLTILSRRRKRWYAGHCDACGYDMAGTPKADRCPECGAGWRTTRAE